MAKLSILDVRCHDRAGTTFVVEMQRLSGVLNQVAVELDAYRKVVDEIEQARQYGEDRFAQGEAKGKAEGVLVVLEARGLVPSPEQCERIRSCDDPGMIERWLRQAVTAGSVDELFVANDPNPR